MTIAVSASLSTSPAGVPRVLVNVTWTTGTPPSSVTVYRDAGGVRSIVRQGYPLNLSAGSGSCYDYEAAFDVAATYTATDGSTYAPSSAAVTPTSGGVPWLIHPGRPESSQPLVVGTWPTWSRPVRAGIFQPIGRKYAVVVGSVRESERGSLSVYTAGWQARDAFLNLIGDGVPLLLNGTAQDQAGRRWVALQDVTEAPTDGGFGSSVKDFVVWTLPVIAVDEPTGYAIPSVTYAATTAAQPNYVSTQNAAPTYADRTSGAQL